jgi:Flp pilus assembly protein TadG
MIDSTMIFKKLSKAAMRCVRSESGAALVEMAISSTVVLATFVSIFQLTMACYHYNTVAEVARESARWAAVRGSTCSINTPGLDHCGATVANIQDYAKTIGAMNWSQCTTNNPCISVSWKTATTTTGVTQPTTTWATCASNCKNPGDMVVVTMTYPYSFSIPFFKQYSLNLSSTSEMIVAQ